MKEMSVEVVFSEAAEAVVQRFQGIAAFEIPQGGFGIGDTVCLRFAPGKEALEFVCTARRWSYEAGAVPVLRLTLSLLHEPQGKLGD